MPIEKIPVVHRFGIISHNQRLDLQERLLKKAVEQATAVRPGEKGASRNPNELHESFVHQFNGASNVEDKEKLEQRARKHIERLKTKAGLNKDCKVSDKQLDEVWVDLTILSQCKGKIQEESLDVLIATLDLATFDQGHIQGLFFLAETVLYWLRTDAINSPYLRMSEIKLLRMAYMVFLRIFYHHMVGDLRGHGLFKSRLYMYLDGLNEYQEAYSPYPNAHLCLRYVIEVGKVIFLDDDLDPGEVKEGVDDSQQRSHFAHSSSASQPRSAASAVSRSVHDLTPTLWHALDVWRCVTVTGKSIDEALHALSMCGLGMSLESWIDGAAALLVLGEAAKRNLATLDVLQNLARGRIPTSVITEDGLHPPAEMYGHMRRQPNISKPDESEFSRHAPTLPAEVAEDLKDIQEAINEADAQLKQPKSSHKITRQSQRTTTSPPPTQDAQGLETGKRPDVGTKYQQRESVSRTTYGNSPTEESPGMQGWHWELAVIYTETLTELVVHGNLTSIQKRALLGSRHTKNGEESHFFSTGLLDMARFQLPEYSTEDDWSWRVRYSAIQGLVQICGHFQGNKMADGLYNTAWRALLESNAHEHDEKVLEALKVGQVTVKQKTGTTSSSLRPTNAGSRLANGLAKRYLPPAPIVTAAPSRPARKSLPKHQPTTRPAARTSLKEESKLAELTDQPNLPDFKTRTSKDLMRIVEDQWRKDLQLQLKLEEEQDGEVVAARADSILS